MIASARRLRLRFAPNSMLSLGSKVRVKATLWGFEGFELYKDDGSVVH